MTSSALALWHPDGVAATTRVLGAGCPPRLAPDGGRHDGPADLVIVAPDAAERRRHGWLGAALAEAAATLAPDGVLAVLVPAASRARARAGLAPHGLALAASVAHLPSFAISRYLVPVDAPALRYAVARLMPTYPRVRRAAVPLLRPIVAAGLGRVLPSVALLAYRPTARPPLAWIATLAGTAENDGTALATRVVAVASWRAYGGPTVLHVLAPGTERARAVVKVPADRDDEHLATEAARLTDVAPTAAASGMRVPAPRLGRLADGRPVLVQTPVAGRPLAGVIAARPHALAGWLETIRSWLVRWQRATAHTAPLDDPTLARLFWTPAARVTPLIADGDAYRSWLAARVARLAGTPITLAACHHDLTMRNLLLDDAGVLGLVDWETADPHALPGSDFVYAAVDAVAAARGDADRPAAFAACFAPDGALAAAVSDLIGRSQRELGLTPALGELAFHACWLHHAANEVEARAEAGRGPFLAIAAALARDPERLGARCWS